MKKYRCVSYYEKMRIGDEKYMQNKILMETDDINYAVNYICFTNGGCVLLRSDKPIFVFHDAWEQVFYFWSTPLSGNFEGFRDKDKFLDRLREYIANGR